MLYELSNAFGSRFCRLGYSPEEWKEVAASILGKRRRQLLSRVLRGLLIALVALFGNLPPIWKYLLLALAAASVGIGLFRWFTNPALMAPDGRVLREKEFDGYVSDRLLAYFRAKNRNYGSCSRVAEQAAVPAETESIPLSVFVPSAAKEKPKPELRSVLLLGFLSLVLALLLYLLIRNWVKNVVDSNILTTFVYAELGLAALLFFARPKSSSRRACVAVLCVFLFVFFGLHVYSGRVVSRCLNLADGAESFRSGTDSGAFIIRRADDSSRAVIYALPGDPACCAYYVIADPDVCTATAEYTGSVTVTVRAFSTSCSVFRASDRSCLKTFDTSVQLPEQVSASQSYDLRPDDLQVVQASLAALEQ